ncbi:histidine kinase [Paenibacillus sp. FSL W8-0186]|uniref:histidine kinase n=1 Tax=Paenibacillus woosongensis TaxID=307580 RepID=A0ABQ4MNK0_9BACL|nr:histidine kinase [Paenibacillus woosongensis]GIP57474.1 histidine kinase [Paenibacillus woosongensis]
MLRKNSIFIKILVLMLSGILVISLLLTLASSTISERILLNQVVKNASANMNHVKDELLNYNDQVVNTMLQISSSSEFRNYITKPANTPQEQINLVMSLGKYIDLYKDYLSPEKSHIIVSALPGLGGRHYSSNALKWDKIPQDIVSTYMTEDSKIPNRIRYNSSPDLFVETVPYDNYIFATKPLVHSGTGWMYGYAAVVMDEQNIYRKYSPYISEGIHISLISSDGTILSSSRKDSISKKNTTLLSLAGQVSEQGGVWSDSEDKQTYISYYLPEFNAYLLEEIDQLAAFAPLYRISTEILTVISVVLLVTMPFVYSLSRRITRPLSQLVKTMQTSKGDNLKFHPLKEGDSYETNVLTKAYNRMIREIDQYTDKLVYEQQERRKADLNALQMQINPHFLYNTLSSIKYLAKMHRTDEVDQTIDSLISMLQSTLGSTEDMVTVETEIETLKHYVFINRIRYGEQIGVHYEIAEDCSQLLVPKLIIQPFVENAFFHAFPGTASGNIHIFIRRLEERLMIEIMDDGVGMSSTVEQINEKKKHHLSGIGVNNVHARIQLLFGADYGVQIESEAGYGTAIKITLPVTQSVEQMNN